MAGGAKGLVGGLAEVEEAAQSYAGLSRFSGRVGGGCEGALCGEQVLDGESGLFVQGRDVHHGKSGLSHVCFVDRSHTQHYAQTPGEVLPQRRLHPSEDTPSEGS